jgi:hypothetical protein
LLQRAVRRPSWERQEKRTPREERTDRGMIGLEVRRYSAMTKARREKRERMRGVGWISPARA